METKCREDCKYYSTYTKTCDYTLLMHRAKRCPASGCVKYEPRTEKSRWNRMDTARKKRLCGEARHA